jgi:hypothetical protein
VLMPSSGEAPERELKSAHILDRASLPTYPPA